MSSEELPLKPTQSHWRYIFAKGVMAVGNTPEELWNAAIAYFSWCDENPIYRNEVIRSGKRTGDVIQVPIPRPYTINGLCLRLGITKEYLYSAAKSDTQNEFFFVAKNILEIIYTQKLELVYAGVYSPMVAIRDMSIGLGKADDSVTPQVVITVEGNAPKLLTNEADIEIPKDKI